MYKPEFIDEKLYIPSWIYEDTPVDYDYVENDCYVTSKMDYESYRNLRRISYFACRWYPLLKGTPTIESVILKTDIYDFRADLKQLMNQYPDYKFIRLCGGSPKDVVHVPVFGSSDRAADALINSSRTRNIIQNYHHFHLFIRRVVTIHNECRCFIHQHQLRAVSVYEKVDNKDNLEKSLINFFENYQLPYNSCVAEIAWSSDTYSNPFLVEINSFGVDGFADGSLFNWDLDKEILYHSIIPVFRYPK